jgi:hypothetical protein
LRAYLRWTMVIGCKQHHESDAPFSLYCPCFCFLKLAYVEHSTTLKSTSYLWNGPLENLDPLKLYFKNSLKGLP